MIVYLWGRKSTAYFGPSSIPQAVLSSHPLDARHLSSLEFISSYLVIASLGICSLFMWFLQQGLAFAPYPTLTTTNHSYRGVPGISEAPGHREVHWTQRKAMWNFCKTTERMKISPLHWGYSCEHVSSRLPGADKEANRNRRRVERDRAWVLSSGY